MLIIFVLLIDCIENNISHHLHDQFWSLEKNTLPKSKKKMSTHALIFFKEFDCIESSERGHNSVMSHSRNSLLNPNQTP